MACFGQLALHISGQREAGRPIKRRGRSITTPILSVFQQLVLRDYAYLYNSRTEQNLLFFKTSRCFGTGDQPLSRQRPQEGSVPEASNEATTSASIEVALGVQKDLGSGGVNGAGSSADTVNCPSDRPRTNMMAILR